jgi:hypothetical protein
LLWARREQAASSSFPETPGLQRDEKFLDIAGSPAPRTENHGVGGSIPPLGTINSST